MKSALLLSVSVHPLPPRMAAVVLERAGVGAVSEKFALPKPTVSTIDPVHVTPLAPLLHVTAVALLTRKTLPAVADMEIVPVASGVGKGTEPPHKRFLDQVVATRRNRTGESRDLLGGAGRAAVLH